MCPHCLGINNAPVRMLGQEVTREISADPLLSERLRAARAHAHAGETFPRDSDDDPVRVVLRVEFASGAYRQYTAVDPLEWHFAIAPTDGSPRSEPQIALMFAGNPDAGGIKVQQEGMP